MSDDYVDAAQRKLLAQSLSESRRELELMMERMELEAVESFDEVVRPSVGTLLREARAGLVQAWHRINGDTSWPAAMRGPVLISDIPPLLQSALADTLIAMDVQPRFQVERGLLARLIDTGFSEGTALELMLDTHERPEIPRGALAVVLVPAERYLVIACAWVVGELRAGGEWPRQFAVNSKIGPLRAERWKREELAQFLSNVTAQFHAAALSELTRRKSLNLSV